MQCCKYKTACSDSTFIRTVKRFRNSSSPTKKYWTCTGPDWKYLTTSPWYGPDDNFGYIRHFPDEKERKRTGGNGVYYHTSYWGEPHDFLWLGIVQPSLMYQQMKTAYDRNMRKIWVLNVGDIQAVRIPDRVLPRYGLGHQPFRV